VGIPSTLPVDISSILPSNVTTLENSDKGLVVEEDHLTDANGQPLKRQKLDDSSLAGLQVCEEGGAC
jgi:hypothetical protein